MNAATFILSTGRCGTQWLAHFFEVAAGDSFAVTHEPLESLYVPRRMLAAKSPSNLPPEDREPIEEHLASIENVLKKTSYIECGHPCWSSIPFLIDHLKQDVRIIHLVRHPVPTAWSWLTHRAYCPPLYPALPEKILLSPFDTGAHFPEYRGRWGTMSPYEKALYYWLEVNAFGLRLSEEARAKWLTVSFEELFARATQERLLEFVGAEPGRADLASLGGQVDRLRAYSELAVDPFQIAAHAEILRLAERFGYDPLRFDAQALKHRYFAPPESFNA